MNLTGQLRGHADRKHGWGRAQPTCCLPLQLYLVSWTALPL
jgi:hypothetical protein